MNAIIHSCILLIFLITSEVMSNPVTSMTETPQKNPIEFMDETFRCLISQHFAQIQQKIYMRYGDIRKEDLIHCPRENQLQLVDFEDKVKQYSTHCYENLSKQSKEELISTDETKFDCDDAAGPSCSENLELQMFSLTDDMNDCLSKSMNKFRDSAIAFLNKISTCVRKTRTLKEPTAEEITAIRRGLDNMGNCSIFQLDPSIEPPAKIDGIYFKTEGSIFWVDNFHLNH